MLGGSAGDVLAAERLVMINLQRETLGRNDLQ